MLLCELLGCKPTEKEIKEARRILKELTDIGRKPCPTLQLLLSAAFKEVEGNDE